jgi:2-oxoglutarate ferredoxin oxidoreductase subunit beta
MSIAPNAPLNVLKPADFASDQDIRWCPGCGDYSILAQTKKIFAKLGLDRSKTVFISGIGCSSRFPYYMNTLRLPLDPRPRPDLRDGSETRSPDLNIWMVTGDGDGLSIGGNHLMHIIRRNVDVKILLFNNRIYGSDQGPVQPDERAGEED